MKQAQQQLTEKQYMKAWLRLLSAAANTTRHIIKQVDNYFFCEEDADIKPHFYGSLSFGIATVLFVYIVIL